MVTKRRALMFADSVLRLAHARRVEEEERAEALAATQLTERMALKRHSLRRWRMNYARLSSDAYDRVRQRALAAGVCTLCALPISSGEPMDFDHILPIALGGAHSEENLQWVHATCNRRKGCRDSKAPRR